MEHKVSIIIPVYKAEQNLRKCVESLVFGAYRNLEIILVEDCSPDGSWDECQKLAAEFSVVYCIRNERNSGVSYTRNRGISMATGTYICFVDSDDWVSGRYVSRLVETVTAHPNALVLCGFRFHEEMAGYSADYLWDSGEKSLFKVYPDQFFALQEKVLLQSPCNKVFRRDVVMDKHLSFDEAQSMGEDFQFVLDYMEAAMVQQCVIINEPLYHYIRANNASLMSKFGLVERENEFGRLAQLKRICGENDSVDKQYHRAIDMLKKNYIYHAMHNHTLNEVQKTQYIQEILEVENSWPIYFRYRLMIFKENLAQLLSSIKKLPKRAVGHFRRKRLERFVQRQREQYAVSCKRISIISQNCIGGVLYHDLGLEFSSPTVNLFFKGSDFVRFVLNLKRYLDMDLVMNWGETYPIGYMGDVEIHFMHFATCTAARDAWNRRKARVNWDNIVVLCTDMEDFSKDVFDKWKTICYPKVLFTANAVFAGDKDSVYYPENQRFGHVEDLIPKREFYRDGRVMAILNCSDKESR